MLSNFSSVFLKSQTTNGRKLMATMVQLDTRKSKRRLRPVFDTIGRVGDPYIEPTSIPLTNWRERLIKWASKRQSYMWGNYIKQSLALTEKDAKGYRISRPNLSKKYTLAFKTHIPMISKHWSKRSFVKEAVNTLSIAHKAYALGDTTSLREISADLYFKRAEKDIKKRNVPKNLSLEWTGEIQNPKIVSVRCAVNPAPRVEFGQILLKYTANQTVSVKNDQDHIISSTKQVTDEVVAFERNLLQHGSRWLLLDTLKKDVVAVQATPTTASGASKK